MVLVGVTPWNTHREAQAAWGPARGGRGSIGHGGGGRWGGAEGAGPPPSATAVIVGRELWKFWAACLVIISLILLVSAVYVRKQLLFHHQVLQMGSILKSTHLIKDLKISYVYLHVPTR